MTSLFKNILHFNSIIVRLKHGTHFVNNTIYNAFQFYNSTIKTYTCGAERHVRLYFNSIIVRLKLRSNFN